MLSLFLRSAKCSQAVGCLLKATLSAVGLTLGYLTLKIVRLYCNLRICGSPPLCNCATCPDTQHRGNLCSYNMSVYNNVTTYVCIHDSVNSTHHLLKFLPLHGSLNGPILLPLIAATFTEYLAPKISPDIEYVVSLVT